jgi:peptide/nickel transport system substrate-binding protein
MKSTMRTLRVALACLFLLPLALACGGPGEAPSSSPELADTPRRGGTLVVGTIADLTSVNQLIVPTSSFNQDIHTALFLQLVEEQPDYAEHPPTFKPMLAERWEYSEDRLSITFYLRDDVTWSDGTPVTAEDVRFTWQAQIHPDVAWDSVFYKEPITDVEVIDPYTVRFHYERPFANQLIYTNEGVILPAHAWGQLPFSEWRENSDWFLEHLVVDGPYTLGSWKRQQEIVLERNERYYDSRYPYIDRVVLRQIPDRASQVAQALAGDLDYIYGLGLADVPSVEASDKLELRTWWTRGYVFVAWNVRRPLFSDVRVRQAMTLAMNRQEIVDAIYGRFGKVATSPIISTVWAYDDQLVPWPYDPEEARRLLSEAGWEDTDGDGVRDRDGVPFRFDLVTNAGNQQRLDAAVMIQQYLAAVGVEARPRTQAFNSLMEQLDRGDYEACVMKFNMATDLDITAGYHTSAIGTSFNVFGYSNPELDQLIDAATQVERLEEIPQYLDPAQEILHRDQPLTFLWENQHLAALNRRVRGAEPNLLRTFWHIWEWWLADADG